MRFLDLQTGHSFDALWSDSQTNGYTFWFPNEQSVDITYTMPICMLTTTAEPIKVTIEDNDIFHFISSTQTTNEDGFCFGIPEKTIEQFTEDAFKAEAADGMVRWKFTELPISNEAKLLMDALVLGLEYIQEYYGKKYIKIVKKA